MSRIEKRTLEITRMGKRIKRERMSTLMFCIIVIVISLALRLFVLGTISVDGPSMEPTLWTGEHVMINKLTVKFGLPKRYDVVVCKFVGTEKNFIKRVVALPGETVEVKNGYLLVNGKSLPDDPFGNIPRTYDMEKITVPQDSVFVMGDNRDDSADSVVYGPVPHKLIEGVAFVIVWPFNQIKFL